MKPTSWLMLLAALAAVAGVPARGDDVAVQSNPKSKTRSSNTPSSNADGVQALAFDAYGKLLQPPATAIGVTVGPADSVLRSQLRLKAKEGVVVTRVLPKSRAEKAGIRKYDILLKLGGKTIAVAGDLRRISEAKKGQPLKVELIRGAKCIHLTLEVPKVKAKLPSVQANALLATSRNMYWVTTSPWKYEIGLTTAAADASLVAQLVLPPKTGLVVRSVKDKGPAAKAGLQKYDVVLKAADKYLSKPSDLNKAVDKAAGKPLTLEFLRAGRKQTCTVTPVKRPQQDFRLWVSPYEHQLRNYWVSPQLHGMTAGGYGSSATLIRIESQTQQIAQLARQIAELRKSLDKLQKTLAARQTKK